MTVGRRHALHLGLAFGAAVSAPAAATAAADERVARDNRAARLPRPARRSLDFRDPGDNIVALVKTLGDLSGRATWSISFGRIFGAVADRTKPRDARCDKVEQRRCEIVADGAQETRFRGMIYFTDLETGAFLGEWRNPFTGRTNQVVHWATLGQGGYTYTRSGLVARATFRGAFGSDKRGRPLILPWIINGDDVWLMLDERVKYVRPADGALRTDNAINRYQTSLRELEDPDVSSAVCRTSWHTEQNWMVWMGMDERPGRLM